MDAFQTANEVMDAFKEHIKEISQMNSNEINANTKLTDLFEDSLEFYEVIISFEEKYNIRFNLESSTHADSITLGELIHLID